MCSNGVPLTLLYQPDSCVRKSIPPTPKCTCRHQQTSCMCAPTHVFLSSEAARNFARPSYVTVSARCLALLRLAPPLTAGGAGRLPRSCCRTPYSWYIQRVYGDGWHQCVQSSFSWTPAWQKTGRTLCPAQTVRELHEGHICPSRFQGWLDAASSSPGACAEHRKIVICSAARWLHGTRVCLASRSREATWKPWWYSHMGTLRFQVWMTGMPSRAITGSDSLLRQPPSTITCFGKTCP